MAKQAIPFTTGTHEGRNAEASSAVLDNLYAEKLPPDAKTPVTLYGRPGLSVFAELPENGPVLGMGKLKNRLYAATPTALYRIYGNGDVDTVGSVTFYGSHVTFAENGETLVCVDGTFGYSYNDDDGLQQLSGDGWYPAETVTFQDGYFIFSRSGTSQFFISDLYSTNFDPLKYASAEAAPDVLKAVLSDHRELWLFGEHSIEVWYNSGDPDFPFTRRRGAYIERGVVSPHCIAKMDNTVFWADEYGIVLRAQGYQPQRISTHAVEYDIHGEVGDVFAYTYTEEGHTFYVMTLPAQNKTWVFDVSTGEWHNRSHIDYGQEKILCQKECYDRNLAGAPDSGKIYEMSLDYTDDDGRPIINTAVTPPLHAQRNRAFMTCFELDMETGQAPAAGVNADPQAMLQWSDDGGHTWSNEHWQSAGKTGEHRKRVKWHRLGTFRERIMNVSISDSIPVKITGAYAEVYNGGN